eukprot:6065322-Prymnesium_polylepis.2
MARTSASSISFSSALCTSRVFTPPPPSTPRPASASLSTCAPPPPPVYVMPCEVVTRDVGERARVWVRA